MTKLNGYQHDLPTSETVIGRGISTTGVCFVASYDELVDLAKEDDSRQIMGLRKSTSSMVMDRCLAQFVVYSTLICLGDVLYCRILKYTIRGYTRMAKCALLASRLCPKQSPVRPARASRLQSWEDLA